MAAYSKIPCMGALRRRHCLTKCCQQDKRASRNVINKAIMRWTIQILTYFAISGLAPNRHCVVVSFVYTISRKLPYMCGCMVVSQSLQTTYL